MARGIRFRCPRCGEGHLFRKFLKPVDRCETCDQDWSLQCADDFPAYVAVLLTGHLLAPLMILLGLKTDLSVAGLLAILMPSATILMIGMLQPAKGAIIAVQWWFGLHGFIRERPIAVDPK
ncbi:MAG: DUF983 domain-containing protein [Novosphingobium sp.]